MKQKCKIEGEEMELDSYIKHKKFGVSFIPDYTKKIDDLYDSYSFAKTHRLNKENIFKVHEILRKNLISENQRGKLRNVNMYVTTADRRIEYVAATPFIVEQEMNKLFHDLSKFRVFGRNILVRGFADLMNRMLSMITENAEEQYMKVL